MGPQQQFCKVDQPAPLTGLFVGGVDAHHRLGVQITLGRLDVARSQSLVFLPVDEPLGLLRRPARFVQIQLTANALDDAKLVVAIENLKLLR